MVALAVTESYATIEEADVYLENNTYWFNATDESKTTALLEARYYIDSNFSCIDLTDELEIPEQLKYATSVLAGDSIENTAIFESGANIKREYVKADVVESEVEYFSGRTNKPTTLDLVRGILKGICTYSKSTTFLQRS